MIHVGSGGRGNGGRRLLGEAATEMRGAARAMRRTAGVNVTLLLTFGLALGVGLPLLDLAARGAAHEAPVLSPVGLHTPVWDAGSVGAGAPGSDPEVREENWGGRSSEWTGARRQGVTELQRDALGVLLETLWSSAVLVLLVACSNLALLLLSRSAARRWELAMRSALGASPRRLLGRLGAEAALLVGAGWAVGLLLVSALTGVLTATWPGVLQRWLHLLPSASSFLVAVGLPTLCVVLFSVLPALAGAERGISGLVSAGHRATTGRREGQARSRLTVVAVALSLSLLVAGGLLLRSFTAPLAGGASPYPADSLAMRIALPEGVDAAARAELLEQLLEGAAAVPGVVTHAVASDGAVLGLGSLDLVHAITGNPTRPGILRPARHHSVSAGFFSDLGIELVAGREFGPEDRAASAAVVMVNEAFVNRFFQRIDPVGRTLQSGGLSFDARFYTVVGVVPNLRPPGIGNAAEPEPAVYFSALQVPPPVFDLVVRTPRELESVVPALETVAAAAAPGLALLGAQTLAARVAEFRRPLGWIASLFALLAAATVVLSAFGLYAVITFNVSRRTRELGVRMALGASPRSVVRLVLREGVRLTFVGLAFGLAGALCLARLLDFFFQGVRPLDPAVYLLAAALLTLVALLASYGPARRASRLDPAVALRIE